MEPQKEALLAANALIRKHGAGAEEYVAQQLWSCRQNSDVENAKQWRSLLEAIRKVRDIRKEADG